MKIAKLLTLQSLSCTSARVYAAVGVGSRSRGDLIEVTFREPQVMAAEQSELQLPREGAVWRYGAPYYRVYRPCHCGTACSRSNKRWVTSPSIVWLQRSLFSEKYSLSRTPRRKWGDNSLESLPLGQSDCRSPNLELPKRKYSLRRKIQHQTALQQIPWRCVVEQQMS